MNVDETYVTRRSSLECDVSVDMKWGVERHAHLEAAIRLGSV